MAETADKNIIDKDEYPQAAELERRCVAMLADLWNAPDPDTAIGCSTTGSSEACMLAGMALKRRWMHRNADRYAAGARPNLVMGTNVQVCWEKFCNFWEVEARQVPMAGDRFHLGRKKPPRGVTRTPSAWWPSSARRWTAATSRSPRSAPPSTRWRRAPRPSTWTARPGA